MTFSALAVDRKTLLEDKAALINSQIKIESIKIAIIENEVADFFQEFYEETLGIPYSPSWSNAGGTPPEDLEIPEEITISLARDSYSRLSSPSVSAEAFELAREYFLSRDLAALYYVEASLELAGKRLSLREMERRDFLLEGALSELLERKRILLASGEYRLMFSSKKRGIGPKGLGIQVKNRKKQRLPKSSPSDLLVSHGQSTDNVVRFRKAQG